MKKKEKKIETEKKGKIMKGLFEKSRAIELRDSEAQRVKVPSLELQICFQIQLLDLVSKLRREIKLDSFKLYPPK